MRERERERENQHLSQKWKYELPEFQRNQSRSLGKYIYFLF